jgi:excisionase family DNA binding protein
VVNLKTAARMLGVHYQTAYRYVRSGELVAVKVGSSYNISLGAVELLRQRLAVMEAPVISTHREPPPPVDDIDAELDTLIGGVMLTAQPVSTPSPTGSRPRSAMSACCA